MYNKIKLTLVSLLSVILISSASFARDLVITFDDMNPGPKAAFENAIAKFQKENPDINVCLLYTSPSPRDRQKSRMPSSA